MDGAGVVRRGVASVQGIGYLCAWNGHLRGSHIGTPGESALTDNSRRYWHTNDHSLLFSALLLESDPRDQRAMTFSACQRMSGR